MVIMVIMITPTAKKIKNKRARDNNLSESILIVCVGNICRSPMGEYLFRKMSQESGEETRVSSAGLGALTGHGADALAIEVMREHGVNVSEHRARQLDEALVKNNELILVMEVWQKNKIEQLYPFSKGRVHLLGKWDEIEISDPYKMSKTHFIDAYEDIKQSCQQWCEKLYNHKVLI